MCEVLIRIKRSDEFFFCSSYLLTPDPNISRLQVFAEHNTLEKCEKNVKKCEKNYDKCEFENIGNL